MDEGSLWIFRVPAATSPPVELQRRIIDGKLYAIVWDTDHGHLIYLEVLGDTGDHRDWLAVRAAELIEPRWWSSAVVVMPLDEGLHARREDEPFAYVYRLTTGEDSEPDDDAVSDFPFAGLRRRLARSVPALVGPAEPRAVWEGQLDVADIATVLGTAIPVWVAGTQTVDNAQRALSDDRTFTAVDTTTEWPTVQARLEKALQAEVPVEFPAGFAALAVDAAGVLRTIRTAHAQLPDTGPGWYLVCRPAKPVPAVELEQTITAVTLVTDMDLVAKELTELRAVEGELDIDDPRGEPYAEAITLLSWQLRQAAKDEGSITDLRQYVPVADDDLITYSAPWRGPVVDAWINNLTPIEDLSTILGRRRVRTLLGAYQPGIVRQAYRDDQGRYVVVVEYSAGDLSSLAEWPKSLQVVATWTDKTVLAADDTGGPVTLLALTPTDEGRMRTDPVPMPPYSGQNCYAYGYGGGTPIGTYQAILRCAVGDVPEPCGVFEVLGTHHSDATPVSQLWQAISTTQGPLRMSWPQVQMWARTDQRNAKKRSRQPP